MEPGVICLRCQQIEVGNLVVHPLVSPECHSVTGFMDRLVQRVPADLSAVRLCRVNNSCNVSLTFQSISVQLVATSIIHLKCIETLFCIILSKTLAETFTSPFVEDSFKSRLAFKTQ